MGGSRGGPGVGSRGGPGVESRGGPGVGSRGGPGVGSRGGPGVGSRGGPGVGSRVTWFQGNPGVNLGLDAGVDPGWIQGWTPGWIQGCDRTRSKGTQRWTWGFRAGPGDIDRKRSQRTKRRVQKWNQSPNRDLPSRPGITGGVWVECFCSLFVLSYAHLSCSFINFFFSN